MQVQIAYQEVLQTGSRCGANRRTCNVRVAEVPHWLGGARASEADPRPKHDGSGFWWESSGIDGHQGEIACEKVATDHRAQSHSQTI